MFRHIVKGIGNLSLDIFNKLDRHEPAQRNGVLIDTHCIHLSEGKMCHGSLRFQLIESNQTKIILARKPLLNDAQNLAIRIIVYVARSSHNEYCVHV